VIVFEIEHEVYLMAGIFLTPSEITETMLHYRAAEYEHDCFAYLNFLPKLKVSQ
jgi:hypothetical protein